MSGPLRRGRLTSRNGVDGASAVNPIFQCVVRRQFECIHMHPILQAHVSTFVTKWVFVAKNPESKRERGGMDTATARGIAIGLRRRQYPERQLQQKGRFSPLMRLQNTCSQCERGFEFKRFPGIGYSRKKSSCCSRLLSALMVAKRSSFHSVFRRVLGLAVATARTLCGPGGS